jgi:hypothetical protein
VLDSLRRESSGCSFAEWLELKSKALAVIAAAGLSLLPHGSFPPAAGKLLTGQEFGGDSKKCMDAAAKMIDAKTKDASLL